MNIDETGQGCREQERAIPGSMNLKGANIMLTWNVTYHCKAGQRAAFYQALCELGVRENSRAEEGNCRYDYYFAAEAPDDLLLVETWTSPALQQAHCGTDVFAKLQELKARFCDGVEIDRFSD